MSVFIDLLSLGISAPSIAISKELASLIRVAIRPRSFSILFCFILSDHAASATAIKSPKRNEVKSNSQLCWIKYFILDIWLTSCRGQLAELVNQWRYGVH